MNNLSSSNAKYLDARNEWSSTRKWTAIDRKSENRIWTVAAAVRRLYFSEKEFVYSNFRNEQLLRENFNKELEESKRRYEQTISKKDEKTKNDLERINKLSMEVKVKHENEKQEVCTNRNEYTSHRLRSHQEIEW